MCIQTPALGSESICTWIQATPLLQIRLLWDGGGVWCREEDQSTQRPGGCRQCGSTSGGLPQNQVGAVLLSSFLFGVASREISSRRLWNVDAGLDVLRRLFSWNMSVKTLSFTVFLF